MADSSLSLGSRLPALDKVPIVGILRRCPPSLTVEVIEAAAGAGLTTIEVTLDSDEPLGQLRALTDAFPELTLGAGTVFDSTQASNAIGAGAAFLVSPVASNEVLETCLQAGVPYLPGAATPSEIWTAFRAGATAVKVFPAREIGGPAFLSAIRVPLGEIPLVPTGGVTLESLGQYLEAGAAAVGLGSSIFPDHLLRRGRVAEIGVLVARAVESAT